MYESVLEDPKSELQYQCLKVSYALQEAWQAIVNAFKPIIEAVCQMYSSWWRYICKISKYDKAIKRVSYLAIYGKKYRTRKKSRKRLLNI